MNEDYYFVDASVNCCSLNKATLEYLADECYTVGASIDVTGNNFRFFFETKSNAKAFGGFYLKHYIRTLIIGWIRRT